MTCTGQAVLNYAPQSLRILCELCASVPLCFKRIRAPQLNTCHSVEDTFAGQADSLVGTYAKGRAEGFLGQEARIRGVGWGRPSLLVRRVGFHHPMDPIGDSGQDGGIDGLFDLGVLPRQARFTGLKEMVQSR